MPPGSQRSSLARTVVSVTPVMATRLRPRAKPGHDDQVARGHIQYPTEKRDQRIIGFAIHRRRTQADLDSIAMQALYPVLRGARANPYSAMSYSAIPRQKTCIIRKIGFNYWKRTFNI